jgi:hypothetical protein
MKRVQLVVVVGFCLLCLAGAAQAQTASWKQMPGIILPGNVVGTGTGAVPGGFLPWTTSAGAAHVNLKSGLIHFVVRGLVFAAGAPGSRSEPQAHSRACAGPWYATWMAAQAVEIPC